MIPRERVRSILHLVATLAVVAAVLIVLISAFPQLVGADESFVVMSGSMEPAISVGDTVLVDAVDPTAISTGDVVTFGFAGESQTTTHRVVEVMDDGEQITLRTKGDANENVDPQPVAASDVIGRVVLTVPLVGYLFHFLDRPIGYVLFIGVPFGLLVLSELWSFARSKQNGSTPPEQGDYTAATGTRTDSRTDTASSTITLTQQHLRFAIPIVVLGAVYSLWRAVQAPDDMVMVGLATGLTLLTAFLGLLYGAVGSETEAGPPVEADRSSVRIVIDGAQTGADDVTENSSTSRVDSLQELTEIARDAGVPIVVAEDLRWYRVAHEGETYLLDGAASSQASVEAIGSETTDVDGVGRRNSDELEQ